MPSYFLTVRFPVSILGPTETVLFADMKDYPSGTYYKQQVFYETDSESVAGVLVEQFRHAEPPRGPGLEPLVQSPLVFEVVSTAGLSSVQSISLRDDFRQQFDPIRQIQSLDSRIKDDPAEWADEGLPHDLQTIILVMFNEQARQWEPLVHNPHFPDAPRDSLVAPCVVAR